MLRVHSLTSNPQAQTFSIKHSLFERPRHCPILPEGLEKEPSMKLFIYSMSLIALSLMMAVVANPSVAMACNRIVSS